MVVDEEVVKRFLVECEEVAENSFRVSEQLKGQRRSLAAGTSAAADEVLQQLLVAAARCCRAGEHPCGERTFSSAVSRESGLILLAFLCAPCDAQQFTSYWHFTR